MAINTNNELDRELLKLENCVNHFIINCENINDLNLIKTFPIHQYKIIENILTILNKYNINMSVMNTDAKDRNRNRDRELDRMVLAKIMKIVKPWGDTIGKNHEFVWRVQHWIEGFIGDSITINMMLYPNYETGRSGKNNSILHQQIDTFFYNSPIIQQHRNKLNYQSKIIIDCLLKYKNKTRILMLACGTAPEIEDAVIPILKLFPGARIILNDKMKIYLEQTIEKFNKFLSAGTDRDQDQNQLTFVSENVVKLILKSGDDYKDNKGNLVFKHDDKFHLITAGGLFDYLDDKLAKSMIKIICENHLNAKFFFTNINDNPTNRCLRVFMSRWQLIERTEKEITDNLLTGLINNDFRIDFQRDFTDQTIFVTIDKIKGGIKSKL